MATDDDSDVPESGGVFTFGKSKFADNAPSKFWVRNDRVAEVACGDEHTALVAESGRIFTFGANDWGQLGLGDTKVRTKPSCIKSLKSEKIRAVACGRSSTYVATESGRVYSCGGNSEGQLGQGAQDTSVPKPAPIEGLPECRVKMLTAGADHATLLTEDGEVYVWGGGSEGQLGLGDVEECPTPKLIEMKDKVTCISSGYYHTALCTESGDLYTFGESEHGKLGLGEDPEETNRPQKVSGISGKVRLVACGASHTVAITTTGKVYTFGDGSHGQLGHGNIQLQATTPQEVASLRDSKIVSAACGENHTALISDKGVLFTFGNGRHGKLGLGEENFANQFKPSAVTRFGAFTVERVACGGCHMLVLARPKVQNGEVSSESEQEAEEEVKPTKQLELLRRSDDLDLSGSFNARNRRREKQDPAASMSRTLPPLNSSISGRVLPPLSASFTANSTDNPLNKSMLPPLKKPEASSSEDRKKESDIKETTEESTESDERKDPIKKESQDTLQAAPRPLPRTSPRASPRPRARILHVAEQDKKDGSEESEDSEPKKSAIKPAKQNMTQASPVPRPRFGVKVTPPDAATDEDSEEDDDRKKKDKKNEKPSFRKQQSESEESESEEDSRKKKKEEDQRKEKEKKKKDKGRAKKRGGLFGKKKILDSDEEESESESDESSEKDKKQKDKKKSKVDSEEESEEEVSKKKNKDNKKAKTDSEDEEESSGDKDDKNKNKEKEKEKEEEKKPEKKTKICTLL